MASVSAAFSCGAAASLAGALLIACAASHTGDGPEHDASTGDRPEDLPALETPLPTAPWAPPFALEPEAPEGHAALCHPYSGTVEAVDLWADERGPYLLVDTVNSEGATRLWPSGAALQHHDGTGWQAWYERPHAAEEPGPSRLTGLPGSELLVWQAADCWLAALSGAQESRCVHPQAPETGPTLVDVAMVTLDLRGLLMTDGTTVRVARDDGDRPPEGSVVQWAGEPIAVWADPVGAYVLGSQGLFTPVWPAGGVPGGAYTALRIPHRDDIWIATWDGRLLHYDVVQWRSYPSEAGDLRHVWGSVDTLYFAAPRAFGRLVPDEGSEVLLAWDAPELTLEALYGHGEDVYLAFHDRRHELNACGPVFVVRFDGERFWRM
jgi:hypothetical protein